MNEFIITFRESLEAALIVGIVYTYLVKSGFKNARALTLISISTALVASVVFGSLLILINNSIGNPSIEKLFEASMMYLAAGFLIYMIVWMAKNRNIRENLQSDTASAIKDGGRKGIFLLIFFAILREGFETAMFLFASSNATGDFSHAGFWAGIFLSAGIGYLIFVQGKRINLRTFFNVTSIFLIFFAAGMIAYGTHEFEEFLVKGDHLEITGLKDIKDKEGKVLVKAKDQIPRVWDVLKPVKELPEGAETGFYTLKKGTYYHVMHDKGTIGVFLKGFFGYNSDPNPVEFILWLLSLGGGFFLWRKAVKSGDSLQKVKENNNSNNKIKYRKAG